MTLSFTLCGRWSRVTHWPIQMTSNLHFLHFLYFCVFVFCPNSQNTSCQLQLKQHGHEPKPQGGTISVTEEEKEDFLQEESRIPIVWGDNGLDDNCWNGGGEGEVPGLQALHKKVPLSSPATSAKCSSSSYLHSLKAIAATTMACVPMKGTSDHAQSNLLS